MNIIEFYSKYNDLVVQIQKLDSEKTLKEQVKKENLDHEINQLVNEYIIDFLA